MENEKRLIDADELIRAIHQSDNELHSSIWETDEIVDEIRRSPTVEVVHGRWLYDSGTERHFCSACNE